MVLGKAAAPAVTLHGLPVGFALTAAIWHNDATGQLVMRSLVAYDH
jgi:hypothetical protein